MSAYSRLIIVLPCTPPWRWFTTWLPFMESICTVFSHTTLFDFTVEIASICKGTISITVYLIIAISGSFQVWCLDCEHSESKHWFIFFCLKFPSSIKAFSYQSLTLKWFWGDFEIYGCRYTSQHNLTWQSSMDWLIDIFRIRNHRNDTKWSGLFNNWKVHVIDISADTTDWISYFSVVTFKILPSLPISPIPASAVSNLW